MNETAAGPILTTDGIPLKISLQKSERKNKIRAFLLVTPLLFFILFTFLIPIGDMLLRSVDDSYINTVFPKTFEKYKKRFGDWVESKNDSTGFHVRLKTFDEYKTKLDDLNSFLIIRSEEVTTGFENKQLPPFID